MAHVFSCKLISPSHQTKSLNTFHHTLAYFGEEFLCENEKKNGEKEIQSRTLRDGF